MPSQHDGKDAAVIADLVVLGKSRPWDYQAPSAWDQELNYWVEWIVAHRRSQAAWQGRLEALLARHWPEATQVLKLTSATLLRALEQYGDPRALAMDPAAIDQVIRWGGNFLAWRKPSSYWPAPARAWEFESANGKRRQIREYAKQALEARREGARRAAFARAGQGECGAPSPSEGRRRGHGVRVVDEPWGSKELSCGRGVP